MTSIKHPKPGDTVRITETWPCGTTITTQGVVARVYTDRSGNTFIEDADTFLLNDTYSAPDGVTRTVDILTET